jgi:hypothetical protein
MAFRDRPEYRRWREVVLETFGRKCILCGYPRNLHAHHVRPIRTFPELALDTSNGVPLCGNCHSEINNREEDYIEEFERLQQTILSENDENKSTVVTLNSTWNSQLFVFMMNLFQVVMDMYSELSQRAQQAGQVAVTGTDVLREFVSIFGERSADESSLRAWFVAMKLINGDGVASEDESDLENLLPLLVDDLTLEDAAFITEARETLLDEYGDALTQAPDSRRLASFNFEIRLFTPIE